MLCYRRVKAHSSEEQKSSKRETLPYFVERKKEFLSSDMRVLERLPLDWEQVLRVWIIAAGSLLCLIWILRLLRL